MLDKTDNSSPRTWVRKRFGVLVATAIGALVLVGVVAAANSTAYTDSVGDAVVAPDVTALNVANDDAGTITIQVTVADARKLGLPGEDVGVALDLDQNPDTG